LPSNPIASKAIPLYALEVIQPKLQVEQIIYGRVQMDSPTLQNPTLPNATALNSGQYSCSIIGTGGCDDTKVDVIIDIEVSIPNLATLPVSGDCNTTLQHSQQQLMPAPEQL
jgi:hypothetical protein